MIVSKIFRVDYYKEDAFPPDEEWIPELTHIEDFKVFTEAVAFGKAHCNLTGACGIYQIDIDHKGREHDTDTKWECTNKDHYLV